MTRAITHGARNSDNVKKKPRSTAALPGREKRPAPRGEDQCAATCGQTEHVDPDP